MKTGLNHLHNSLAWVTLIIILVSVLLFIIHHFSKKSYSQLQDKLRLIAVIVTGIQLILGFVIYFINDFHKLIGEMGNSALRFKTLEHPLTMIIAIALIHIGSAKIKRAAENIKNRTGMIFFGISLILILSRTPWERFFSWF